MTEIIKLDLKDRKILFELDRDARQSNSEIAKKVRLNKNTVNYKINRLVEEKVILGYYSTIDSARLGYFSFRVYLRFFNITPEREEEMIKWLKENKHVGVVSRIETIYDLGFMAWVKNVYDFDELWLEFKKKFRKYFWDEQVYVFTRVSHFKRKYLLEQQKQEEPEFIGDFKQVKYDELDMKILRILAENARTPLIEISSKLRTSPRTIAFRIKQLEKNKILRGYRVNINLQAIGYEYYKVNMILDNMDNYEKLLEFAQSHPNIIYIDRTISDLDFEIDVEIKGKQELLRLIDELRGKFNIRSAEICSFKEYLKLETIPQF